jgi:hypothetical protein
MTELPVPAPEPRVEVERAAHRIADWAARQLGLVPTANARDAVVYILDRLVAGVRRSSLLRGGHSRLAHDPAMRHLGFTPSSAHAFAVWLLGRSDGERAPTGVLNAALYGEAADEGTITRWRAVATRFGFATDTHTCQRESA